jgi:hypothetical protein
MSMINKHYSAGNMKEFWNRLKYFQHTKTSSFLTANDFASHYQSVMTDSGVLNNEQQAISDQVQRWASDCEKMTCTARIDWSLVTALVKKLKVGTAPGIDGVTADHLVHGLSPALCSLLAKLYTVILSMAIVPDIFSTGIIIPVLKKPSADPNDASNFRPITLSSVFSKLAEMMIIPS